MAYRVAHKTVISGIHYSKTNPIASVTFPPPLSQVSQFLINLCSSRYKKFAEHY